MSVYMLPNMMLPIKKYKLIFSDLEKFIKKMTKKSRMLGRKIESNIGYLIGTDIVCGGTVGNLSVYYKKEQKSFK